MSPHTDLPLNADPSSRFLPWIVGLMMYLASLSIVIGFSINKLTAQWTQELHNYLTVIMPVSNEITPAADPIEMEFKVFQIIQSTTGIGTVKALSVKDSLNQLNAGIFTEEDLTIFPKILEIEIANRNTFNLDQFKKNLANLSPHIEVEDHQETKNIVHKIAQSTQTISFGIVSMIILGTIAIIAFTSQTSVIIHRNIIEILYLVGATRSYIAKQFQSHAFRIGLRGSLISMILGGLTLIVVSLFGSNLLFLDKLTRFPFVILVFLLTSMTITLFITLSAHLTVKTALKHSTEGNG